MLCNCSTSAALSQHPIPTGEDPDPAVLGLKSFFRCMAPRWIQLDSSAGSKPGTSFSFSWLKCQPGSWRENGKAASVPYPTLHPLHGPCLCSMPDMELRVFMWFPGREKDKRFSPLVWTRGTGKSEAVNTTNSSAPRGAGWASRLAQHWDVSPGARCTARALTACGRMGFRTSPHADAATEPGESMPSVDVSLLGSVIAAGDGLGCKPKQEGGEV